ncbi:lipopolysaccharide biosynthesis protein [Proteiniclasticum sp. C24MP]|uniref:lipopolysaccharide biosynthesis protein n=1 Tax=Proteiniclasticum sp. C24MP TaxID=3374101 RepID=UPI003753EFAA
MSLKNRITQSHLIKGFLMISGGTAFIQVINIVLSPIITRLYSPEEFGILTLYSSVMAVLIVFGSFYYESAIPIAETEEKAINVFALCIAILVLVVSVISVLLFFQGENLLILLDAKDLANYAYLIPIGVFAVGLYNILMKWTLRERDYKSIFKSKVSQSVSNNLVKIILGLLNFGSLGLLLGNITNQSAGVTVLSFNVFRKKSLVGLIRISEIIWCAKRYINFFWYSLPNAVVLSFTTQIPVFFLTSIYGSEIVGYYGLANSIVKLPVALIGASVGEVFYAEAASIGLENPQRLINLSNKLLKKLLVIGIIPFSVLGIFGPQLFSFVFGHNWYDAGMYSQMLSIGVFANLVFHPISRIYGVFERQRLKLVIDLVRFIAIAIGFLVAREFDVQPQFAVLIYSILTMIFYYLTYLFAQIIMKRFVSDLNHTN